MGRAAGVQDLFDVTDTRKRVLLSDLGLLQNQEIDNTKLRTLDGLLQSARVHCISKMELYFLHSAEQLRTPLNLRNEAAAVSLLLAAFAEQAAAAGPAGQGSGAHLPQAPALLGELVKYSETLWPELASGDVALGSNGSGGGSEAAQPPRGVPAPLGSAAADFEAWAREQGVQAAITIASFGALRGCAATRDVRPGEVALSIPESVLIYEDTVRQTDLGRMLMAIPGLTIDNLLIIFTMVDRHDEDSQWARYWRSLPDKYYTGLSFPEELVAQLGGTAAQLELTRAQAHLRQQYAATRPLFDILLQAYPQYLKPEWFDYDSYLWAAELWYSYAFEIEFPPAEGQEEDEDTAAGSPAVQPSGGSKGSKGGKGGKPAATRSRSAAGRGGKTAKARPRGSGTKGSGGATGSSAAGSGDTGSAATAGGGSSKPVMVPFACHINHSPWPHCVRYGRVNPRTRTLDYPAFRPCPEGQQVFISYGPVPNLKLLCYYGFVVPSNPHDVVPLQLEIPDGPLKRQQEAALAALGLGLEHSLQDGPLSKQLLACLRVIVATPDELLIIKKKKTSPLAGPINVENEEQALATLRLAVEGMLGPLEALPLLAGAADHSVHAAAGTQQAEAGTRSKVHNEQGDAAERQLAALSLEQQQQQQQQQQPAEPDALSSGSGADSSGVHPPDAAGQQGQAAAACNENGFDADWHMSRHFCRVYLEGQQAILRRSLLECTALAAAAPSGSGLS